MRLSEKLSKFRNTTVEVRTPIEYGIALAAYTLAGAEVWAWHQGYKKLQEGVEHHTYAWDDCGFLKYTGILESIPGDYNNVWKLLNDVKAVMEGEE